MLLGGFGGVVGGIALLLTLPGEGLPTISLIGAFALTRLGLGAASMASTTAGLREVIGVLPLACSTPQRPSQTEGVVRTTAAPFRDRNRRADGRFSCGRSL